MDNASCPLFKDDIPVSIRNEIKYVVNKTKETDREQSLTGCRFKDRDNVFISDYAVGNLNATEVMPCNKAYGHSEKIFDLHTHPTGNKNTVGITPSTADLVSTVLESVQYKIPQVSCITGPHAKHISCYQPKESVLKDSEKIRKYKQALRYDESGLNDVSPYLREHVSEDFYHVWYDRKTFKKVNPTPKEVVKDALVNSKKYLKFKGIPDLEKGVVCSLIEDLNYPSQGKVSEECQKALHVKNFFGIRF